MLTMGFALAIHFEEYQFWFAPPLIALFLIAGFIYFTTLALKNNNPYARLSKIKESQ
jgi:hypothetical protein